MKRSLFILGIVILLSGSNPVRPEGSVKIIPGDKLKSEISCSADRLDVMTQKFDSTKNKILKIKP